MRNCKIKPIKSTIDSYDGEKTNNLIYDELWQIQNPIGKSFRIGSFFYLYYEKSLFWFRFFGGYGIWGRSQRAKSFQLFSERNGYAKYVKFFGWKFKLLKPY